MLKKQGCLVNRKHVQRLRRMLGLAGMAPGPGTAVQHPGHKVYPYLLRGVAILAEPYLEHRHHLYQTRTRLRILGGHHRLVRAARAGLAHQQQHGRVILCGLPGGGIDRSRQA